VRVLCGVARIILIIAPIVTCAARIHAHVIDAPDTITQELNQCLRLVNVGNHINDIFKYSGFDQLFDVQRAG